MTLDRLQFSNLRSLEAGVLEPGPRLTLITGANGAGKTSILEAAFLAGRGRSFRTHQTEKLVRHGEDALQVFAQVGEPAHRIGLEYRRVGGFEGRLDGRNLKSLAELPGCWFVEVVDPEIHRLLTEGPQERRRWLDWGVFHVEPRFLAAWARYSRALKQRNAALKGGTAPDVWDRELVASGEEVASYRAQWFASLQAGLERGAEHMVSRDFTFSLFQGWSRDSSLSDALSQSRARDLERGSTSVGPHRADVVIRMGEGMARDVCSRGQQKLLALSLVLSALEHLQRQQDAARPTLLLDDPAAELDQQRLSLLVERVCQLQCQLIVTALSDATQLFGTPDRVFHVEQGRLSAVL